MRVVSLTADRRKPKKGGRKKTKQETICQEAEETARLSALDEEAVRGDSGGKNTITSKKESQSFGKKKKETKCKVTRLWERREGQSKSSTASKRGQDIFEQGTRIDRKGKTKEEQTVPSSSSRLFQGSKSPKTKKPVAHWGKTPMGREGR